MGVTNPVRAILLSFAATLIGAAAPVSAQVNWERHNDVSVVWAKSKGLSKIRFESEGDYSPESGCSTRQPEVVTILSHQLYTPNGADDLFRGRTRNGRVNSYRIPFNDAPRVVLSWLEVMIEEGKRVRVQSGQCGNAGFIYVSQIESVK